MRLSEVYASVQGEGPRAGVPTVFVRFAGCNLRCPGWPCDTQHAIDPEKYRSEWEVVAPDELAARVANIAIQSGIKNICLTGGEPFLQNHEELKKFVYGLWPHYSIEAFTNGTLAWPDWSTYTIKFIMDWKLAGSGEQISHLEWPARNASRLTEKDAVKFTVADKQDMEEALQIWLRFFGEPDPVWGNRPYGRPQIFLGPVWGSADPSDCVNFILSNGLPWRLNIQSHKYIWDPEARRT